jgi:subtilisin family serine protease
MFRPRIPARLASLLLAACALAGLGACTADTVPTAPSASRVVPRAAKSPGAGQVIPGHYIVVFRDAVADVDAKANEKALNGRGKVSRTFKAALKGFAGELSDEAAAALRADVDVAYVEQDQVVTADATTQAGAPWGLDRVDQRALPLGTTYEYGGDGTGVTVYILDSGIHFAHAEFGGRAVPGADLVTPGDGGIVTPDAVGADCYGHGTHVAGTVGGTTYGVAKNARLVAVRVLDCSGRGRTSDVIAGVDWVTANRVRPAAANMSVGGGASAALTEAVRRSIAAGVVYVASAGNQAADACEQSPASTPEAITVAASDTLDGFADFSNYGACVDLVAPGTGIRSAWYTSDTATRRGSGTSFAAPHVAGAAALYLQAHPAADPAEVAAALAGGATPNAVRGAGPGTPNLLLYTGFIGGAPSAAPPAASFAPACTYLACTFDATGTSARVTATYAWDFGDGTVGSGRHLSHAYAAGGTYTVALTVVDANGTSTTTRSVTAAPYPPPVAAFAVACDPDLEYLCRFDATGSSASAASYVWEFGEDDGAYPSYRTAPSIEHYFFSSWDRDTSTYTVRLTVTNASGSSTTARVVTIVRPPRPVPAFTYTCAGRTCHFDASATADATAYAWDFGDGTTGGGVTASHTFPREGSPPASPADPRSRSRASPPGLGSFTVWLTASNGSRSADLPREITCSEGRCRDATAPPDSSAGAR